MIYYAIIMELIFKSHAPKPLIRSIGPVDV